MRNIVKGREPRSLTEHRTKANADYDNYNHKDDLRQSLVQEQKGLCCYCMSRIKPDRKHMKIEHWQCQDNYPQRQLDYNNLLGACLGGQGQPQRDQHCDTRKGNSDLSFNPADPSCNVEQMFKFLGNGKIEAVDPAIDREINEILNLNWYRLAENRKAVLDSFKQRLGIGGFNPERELSRWDGSQTDKLPEYSQVIVYWLKKKLKRVSR